MSFTNQPTQANGVCETVPTHFSSDTVSRSLLYTCLLACFLFVKSLSQYTPVLRGAFVQYLINLHVDANTARVLASEHASCRLTSELQFRLTLHPHGQNIHLLQWHFFRTDIRKDSKTHCSPDSLDNKSYRRDVATSVATVTWKPFTKANASVIIDIVSLHS